MVFAAQVISVTVVVAVDELSYGDYSRNAEVLSAVLGRIAPMPIIAATSAMILLEGVRNLMVLSNYLSNRLVKPLIEKRRQEGRAEAHAEWQLWNQRRLEAENRGETFTEPPPDSPNGSNPAAS